MRRRHAHGGGRGGQQEPELPAEPSDPDVAEMRERRRRARRGAPEERAEALRNAAEEIREELDGEEPIGATGDDRRDEFPRPPPPRPHVAFELAGLPSLDAEALMEAEEAEEAEAGATWRFRPGQRWWNRDRFDLDVESSDSADEAKKLPAPKAWNPEDSEDNDDLMWYFKLEEEPAAEESDDSEGYNDWDVDYSKDLWWVAPHHRMAATSAVFQRQVVDPEGLEDDMVTQSPWLDMAPDDVGRDRPQFQNELHAPGIVNAGWEDLAGMAHKAGWPVEVALREDEDVHYTPKNAFEEHEPDFDAAFPERWYLKPLHLERLKAAYRRDRRVKPRRTPFHMNPDKPYPLLVNTKYADATFDWPETKEAFTTMGHAHHPDSDEDPLNDLVDPNVRQEAKKTRIKRFANGGAEIDLDLGDVHAQARPEDVKRTLILAEHGTDYDYPIIPLSKYLKGLWRYWQPTYDNACVGMRYWAYIAIASTFVYFKFCRFERYVAGIYPIEETRYYIPLTVAAISAHCWWQHGWRALPWTYVWAQMSFASVVVGLYTYYHDYSNSFEPAWDQVFLGKDFSLEHLEEEGVGLSPGALVNYFFGSQEKLNVRANLN